MKFAAQTDTGKRRKHNEDCFYVDPKSNLFVIADGMGGHNAGDVASQMVVTRFQKWAEELNTLPTTNPESRPSETIKVLKQLTMEANRRVYNRSQKNRSQTGMGTTLIAGFLEPSRLIFVHIGDSRLYVLRNGVIKQITKDHSLVQEMVDTGKITPQKARVHPDRNIIRRAIGLEPVVEVDFGCYRLKEKDTVLVCTDGLHDMIVDDSEIASLIMSAPNLEVGSRNLVKKALDYGGTDNVTLILATAD